MNTMAKFSLCTLSDEELVKKVDKLTDEMFQRQEVPLRSIPAEPNNDYDLLIGELLIRFSNQVQAGVKVNFAGIKEEFEDKFRHLDENPKLVYSKYSISDLWEWFEQKLKEASKISA